MRGVVFQLEDTRAFAPECAVLLNVSEDHLDRHGDVERLPRGQAARVRATRAPTTWPWSRPGSTRRARRARWTFGGDPPRSSVQRCAAGSPIARERRGSGGAPRSRVGVATPTRVRAAALRSFAGVPHRLEEVAEHGGVLYVNDSKATNVASARGRHRGLRRRRAPDPRRQPQGRRLPRAARAGEAARARRVPDRRGRRARSPRTSRDTAPLVRCGDLEQAVAAARGRGKPGEVVLLSPACASFDQYRRLRGAGGALPAPRRG